MHHTTGLGQLQGCKHRRTDANFPAQEELGSPLVNKAVRVLICGRDVTYGRSKRKPTFWKSHAIQQIHTVTRRGKSAPVSVATKNLDAIKASSVQSKS